MENNSKFWKSVPNEVMSFQYENEPYILHIIKTGFKNTYMVVTEYAYEQHNGRIEFMSKEKIEEELNISL